MIAEFEEKPPEAKPAGPTELDILKEIRDELKNRPTDP